MRIEDRPLVEFHLGEMALEQGFQLKIRGNTAAENEWIISEWVFLFSNRPNHFFKRTKKSLTYGEKQFLHWHHPCPCEGSLLGSWTHFQALYGHTPRCACKAKGLWRTIRGDVLQSSGLPWLIARCHQSASNPAFYYTVMSLGHATTAVQQTLYNSPCQWTNKVPKEKKRKTVNFRQILYETLQVKGYLQT